MKLPHGSRAVIPDEKLLGYILNPDHETHGGHAVLFKQLLDIGPDNADVLREALAAAAADSDATPGKASRYGRKYEVRFEMTGPVGHHTILSIWIIEHGSSEPRLVTAYVE